MGKSKDPSIPSRGACLGTSRQKETQIHLSSKGVTTCRWAVRFTGAEEAHRQPHQRLWGNREGRAKVGLTAPPPHSCGHARAIYSDLTQERGLAMGDFPDPTLMRARGLVLARVSCAMVLAQRRSWRRWILPSFQSLTRRKWTT